MRESRLEVKCFPRHRISWRTTPRRCCASPSNAPQAIEQASEFPWLHADGSRYALKRLHRHGFPYTTTRGEAAKGRRLPPVRRNMPSFRRKTPRKRLSESRSRADTRVKRLHAQTISFAVLSGLFANSRGGLLNPAKPKGAPRGAPFASHTVPLASQNPLRKTHSE
jgi:hypothetical protein